MPQSLQVILDALPELWKGVLVTLQLAAVSGIVSIVLGSLIGIVRLSPNTLLRLAARAYIDFFRGTPLLVQLLIIYQGIPALLTMFDNPIRMDRFFAAIVALSLNAAAYIGEIVRAGIQSIEIGQREASESLGLGPVQTMRYVIFPQAFRRMIPPLGNEFISLLKDTSLVSVISYQELLQSGRIIVARNYRAFEIWIAVALIYLILTLLSSQAFSYLERWMNPTGRVKAQPNPLVTSVSIGGDRSIDP